MARLRVVPYFLFIWILGGDRPAQVHPKKPLEFHISFDPRVSGAPFTGRVFVMVSKQAIKDLPQKPKWFNPEPLFAKDVKDWKPETRLVLADPALSFPKPLAELPKETYSIQAIM